MLLALWRLAGRAGIKVELEGCDASPEAVRYSRETAEAEGETEIGETMGFAEANHMEEMTES